MYKKEDYWKLVDQGINPKPELFSCPDCHHDETGKVNYWIPTSPSASPITEDKDAVSLENGLDKLSCNAL